MPTRCGVRARSGSKRSASVSATITSAPRMPRTFISSLARAPDLLAGLPEAPLAVLEVVERDQQRLFAEVRPEGLGEVDLGVRELPEEEVGDADLAARPHHQLQGGQPRRP